MARKKHVGRKVEKNSGKEVAKTHPTYIPKDYEEFAQIWTDRIKKAILRFRIRKEDQEDLLQDVLLEFIERDYLKIYDPKKGTQFATFVYSYINTRVLRRACILTKNDKKFATNNDTSDDDANENFNLLSRTMESRYVENVTDTDKVVWTQTFKKAIEALDRLPAKGHLLKKDGRIITRSLKAVFVKLAIGMEKNEIAKELGYSASNINNIIVEMRKIPEILQLREIYHDLVALKKNNTSYIGSLGMPEIEQENLKDEIEQLSYFNLNKKFKT